MANLTITVDDEVLKRARIRAIENGTSVNAVVRAAVHAGCKLLLSEDLSHGQTLEGVRIENPFAP